MTKPAKHRARKATRALENAERGRSSVPLSAAFINQTRTPTMMMTSIGRSTNAVAEAPEDRNIGGERAGVALDLVRKLLEQQRAGDSHEDRQTRSSSYRDEIQRNRRDKEDEGIRRHRGFADQPAAEHSSDDERDADDRDAKA